MLQRLADGRADRGLALVTVMGDGSPRAAKRVAAGVGLTAPIVMGDNELFRVYRVRSYPYTVIFDRAGGALAALRGYQSERELAGALERALAAR